MKYTLTTVLRTADRYGVELKLTMADSSGAYLGEATERYLVVNHAGVDLIDPAPGWTVVGGNTVVVRAAAKDIAGGVLPAGALAWQQSRDGTSWSAVTLSA